MFIIDADFAVIRQDWLLSLSVSKITIVTVHDVTSLYRIHVAPLIISHRGYRSFRGLRIASSAVSVPAARTVLP